MADAFPGGELSLPEPWWFPIAPEKRGDSPGLYLLLCPSSAFCASGWEQDTEESPAAKLWFRCLYQVRTTASTSPGAFYRGWVQSSAALRLRPYCLSLSCIKGFLMQLVFEARVHFACLKSCIIHLQVRSAEAWGLLPVLNAIADSGKLRDFRRFVDRDAAFSCRVPGDLATPWEGRSPYCV